MLLLLATAAFIVYEILLYSRHRAPEHPVADELSGLWHDRLLRASSVHLGMRPIYTSIASLFADSSGAPLGSEQPGDSLRSFLLFLWICLAMLLGLLSLWRARRPNEPDDAPTISLERAWGGFLTYQLGLPILLGLTIVPVTRGMDPGTATLVRQMGFHSMALALAWGVMPAVFPRLQRLLPVLGWGILGYGAAFLSISLIELLLTALGCSVQSTNPLMGLLRNASGGEVVEWFFVLAVVGPAVEEIWFRCILLGGLERVLQRPAAIGISAVIFALIHVDPQAALQLFALGAVFGWVRCRSGRWEASWVSHILWNLSTFLLICLA